MNNDPRSYDNFGTTSRDAQAPRVSDARTKTTRTSTSEAFHDPSSPWGIARDPQTKAPLAPNEVNKDSLIRIRNSEMTIEQARQAGFLKDTARGNVFDATQGQAQPVLRQQDTAPQEPVQAQQQTPQPPAAEESLHIGAEGEDTLGFFFRHTAASDHLKAIDQLAATGQVEPHLMGQIASQLGTQPSQVNAMVDKVRPAFESQANRAAEAFGVDAQDVWSWAWEKQPKQMQAAITSHINARTTEAYKAIARDYVASLDTINPDAILGAEVTGGKVSRDSAGRIFFTLANGSTVSWPDAVKSRMVTLSRAK